MGYEFGGDEEARRQAVDRWVAWLERDPGATSAGTSSPPEGRTDGDQITVTK